MRRYPFLLLLLTSTSLSLSAAGPSSMGNATSTPNGSSGLPSTSLQNTKQHPPAQQPVKPQQPLFHIEPKPLLPVMNTPFEMPGIVGWQHEKWVGSDFLGFLSNSISIDVEILKPTDISPSVTKEQLEGVAAEQFKKENLTPQADIKEGPPLPFLHILVVVYPVDKDKIVIMCAARLFEHIQVIRQDFVPNGYWQGITWESSEFTTVDKAKLDEEMKSAVQKATDTFIKRYWQYNKKVLPSLSPS